MFKYIHIIFLYFLSFLFTSKLIGQENNDSSVVLKNVRASSNSAPTPKSYKSLISDKAITTKGFFDVHRIDGRYYFEIPIKHLERDILVTARISTAAVKNSPGTNRNTLMSGDIINDNVISFSKFKKSKIFLKTKYYVTRSIDTARGLTKSLKNISLEPYTSAFDIKAYNNDSTSVVIDVTDFLNSDNDILFFHKQARRSAGGITTLETDKSFVQGIKSFPINIEIKTLKTYKAGSDEWLSYEIGTSMVLLPEKPMRPRYADSRVGYFNTRLIDFDASEKSAEISSMVARWRLEPHPHDLEKYKRGELVEPQKPIIIYIDPATPKKWVPYLIAGVNDWQVAFEQAGFKNAIFAKTAPVDDSSWSLENALYSAIVYKPSNIANASGPHISDPRSGEIIETHINWYHNVMDLLYKWYFVQCANVDPRARRPELDDDLMGELIRFVSSHEVGHTLGLMHNFGSSNSVPVELLRNKKWVEQNGHTPSIMDYARFNYVAQPEDSIGYKGLFPRIGVYDKWAIEWAYRLHPDIKTPEDEVSFLEKLVSDSLRANKFLIYGAQGTNDPRNQSEVLSDDPMKANEYGMRNLKAIVPHVREWVKEPHKGYEKSKEIYKSVYDQYERYITHISKFVTGKYVVNDVPYRPSMKHIELKKQRDAIKFLNTHLFTTPHWLISNPEVFDFYGYFPRIFSATQELIIGALLSNEVFSNLSDRAFYGESGYTVQNYLSELSNYILSEIENGKPVIENERRYLQRLYVESLADKIKPGATSIARAGGFVSMVNSNLPENSDAISPVIHYISTLSSNLKRAISSCNQKDTKTHFIDLNERLESALYAARTVSRWKKK